jgi:hypothetical protein
LLLIFLKILQPLAFQISEIERKIDIERKMMEAAQKMLLIPDPNKKTVKQREER